MDVESMIGEARYLAQARDYKSAGRQILEAAQMVENPAECDQLIAFCDEAEPRAGILNCRRFESARQIAEYKRARVMAMSG